ncbi:MAG: anthranilate synthase component I family protein [Bacteroidota bacterium]
MPNFSLFDSTYCCLFNGNDSKDLKYHEGSLEANDGEGARFGYISYDYKNKIEDLTSLNPSLITFPDYKFFKSEKTQSIPVDALNENLETLQSRWRQRANNQSEKIDLISRTPKEAYLDNFEQIQWHIKRGDIYEVNYCVEWFADNCQINPFHTYRKLNDITLAPFSALVKIEDTFILCASPERYLKKEGNRLISQPIKGTVSRGRSENEDQLLGTKLTTTIKEIAENVMTTDVVRNDFSRIAQKGTVKVKELAALYSFRTVHHLISTIECIIKKDQSFNQILAATFPMPSMTGAPKISAMKIIESSEDFKRGIYSGAIGYIDENDDFDFNVVIRSIIYDDRLKRISVPVGSAITSKSEPEKEWDECLLKVEAMKMALT